MVDFTPLWTVGGVGFFRAFVGWFKNSVADGTIQDVEWKKLAETLAIFLTIGVLAVIGSNYTDSTTIELIGIGAAFLINELWSAWKKKSSTTKAKKKKAK